MAAGVQALCGNAGSDAAVSQAAHNPISPFWYVWLVLITLAGFIVHEFAHWLAGTVLGFDMVMSLNRAWAIGAPSIPEFSSFLIVIAGPVATIAIAALGLFLVYKHSSVFGYALVLSSFAMRCLAFGVSTFSPNDEAKVSGYFGLPWYSAFIVSCSILFVMLVLTIRHLSIRWTTHVISYFVLSLTFAAVIYGDAELVKLFRA